MMGYKTHLKSIFILSLLVGLVLLALFAGAAVLGDFISQDVINTSSNGLFVGSDNGLLTNGTTSGYDLNVSGGIFLNFSLKANQTHGGYVNFSVWFTKTSPNETTYWGANGSMMLNFTTITNTTRNQTSFALRLNGTNINTANGLAYSFLPDGYYNVSIMVQNATANSPTGDGEHIVNVSRIVNLLIDRVAPPIQAFVMNVSSLGNATNLTASGSNVKITVNATVNDTIFTQAVRIGFTNTYLNGTEFNVTASRGNSTGANGAFMFAVEVDTALMTDGIYTIAIYANDSLKNNNVTIANLSFVIDRDGPNVTNIFLGNYTNGANISGNVIGNDANPMATFINITAEVNDSFSNYPLSWDAVVYFNITNTSGQINYTLAEANGSLWNISRALNLSDTRYFPDGLYYIQVWANDSINNLNRTQNLTFRIDRTNPTVSVSCSPSSATAGQTVTCTCTVSDAGSAVVSATSGFGGGVTSESTTASGVGGTSTTCTGFDYAGNRNTATGSWTVTAASSGGSGGGGSGGGISSGVVGTFEKKVWTSINAGETATVAVRNSVLGVTEVSFTVEETTFGAVVEVKKADSLPSTVESYSDGPIYKTLQITERNVEKALKGTATVDFKVEKAWLADNKLAQDDVALHRYSDGAWQQLGTSFKSEDGTYVYYSAQTPGFSYFVIAKKGGAVPAAAAAAGAAGEAAVPAVEMPAETSVESGAEEAALGMGKKSKAVWIIPLVILVVVLGLLYWYWGRRQ